MSDTEPTQPTQPVDVAATIEAPPIDVDEGRQPWTVSQLRGRLKALDRTGRGGKQVSAQQVETLVGDAAFTVGWWERRYSNLADEHGRLQTDYRDLRTIEWEQREQIERYEHPENYSRTPTNAIARVSGGRTHGEQIVARAEEHAARIIANAEEDARRIRATAQLELEAGDAPARPEMDKPLGAHILAVTRWLPQAITAAEGRVGQLEATLAAVTEALPEAKQLVADLHEEREGLVNVFPLANAMLAGDTIDVTEVPAEAQAS
jgi:hypothetical protein